LNAIHFLAASIPARPLPRLRTLVAAGLVLGGFCVVGAGGGAVGAEPVQAEAAHADEAQGTAAGHAGEHHGHGPEIGHNPPANTALKDFESPAWFQKDLAIWSFAVFLGLFALLSKFAWKPIMEGLDKREQGIADTIAATQAAQTEAKQMLASYERRLAEASDEVRTMLEEARRDSDATRQTIVAEARKAAEEEQSRARHEIGLARDEALSSIAQKAGDLAVEVAGKFLREKIGSDEHARMIRESVAGLASATAPSLTKPSMN